MIGINLKTINNMTNFLNNGLKNYEKNDLLITKNSYINQKHRYTNIIFLKGYIFFKSF